MTDLTAMLNALRRPKILIRAARAGVADYRRDRDLKRLVKAPRNLPRSRRSAPCSPRSTAWRRAAPPARRPTTCSGTSRS